MSDNDEPEIEEITLKDFEEEESVTTSARLRRNRARADKRRQDRSPQEGEDSNQEDSLEEQQQQNNSYLARYVGFNLPCLGLVQA